MNRIFGFFAMIVLALGLGVAADAKPKPKRDSGTRVTAPAARVVPSKNKHRKRRHHYKRHHGRRRSMNKRVSVKPEQKGSKPNKQQ